MSEILKNSKDNINIQFKILSAIGIIIIVSGHCYRGGFYLGYNWFPPYSFNIALFAFISGYFYKSKYEDKIINYIWKRAKRLIIPAYFWNIFYGGIIVVTGYFGFSIGEEVSLYNLFVMPFVDGEAFQYNLCCWFVYPMFLATVFNVATRKLFKCFGKDLEILILILYFVIGIMGLQLAINSTEIAGILKLIIRSMYILPCYGLGYFYKIKLECYDKLRDSIYYAILFTIQLIILTSYDNIEYYPSKLTGFENGVILPYITALTGIAFWLRTSKLLVPSLGNSRLIRVIGDNTYSIMIHQMSGFVCLNLIVFLINKALPVLTDFDSQGFMSTVWYYYLPKGKEQYATVYLMFGLFVPILIGKLTKVVINKFYMIKEKTLKA